MNLVKQRIAVAKACGWKPLHIGEEDLDTAIWFNFKGGRARKLLGRTITDQMRKGLPDYLNDLNAIVEATTTLFTCPSQQLLFYQTLIHILDRNPDDSHRFGACLYWEIINATAAQRVEALLRTLNLWEDDSKGE